MLIECRHCHIYGIDLASPSELIAHHRDEQSIADHIGAAKVIYQTLDDLKAACAELSPRQNQEFEVGVFCGQYVTPVQPAYFEHLERVRGESKRLKTVEKARHAVANGVAGEKEYQLAINGAEVSRDGKVVPSAPQDTTGNFAVTINGNGKRSRDEERASGKPPSQTMDISLHNVADYGQETHD